MKTSAKISICIALVTLAVFAVIGMDSAPARAAGPWYVSTVGNDGNDCLSAVTSCASINAATGKASSGDTINVAAGVYFGSGTDVVSITKSINLLGGWDNSFATQSGMATVDGQGARRGMTFASGTTSMMDRFVVQNGQNPLYSVGGGGIKVDAANLTINNSWIRNNTTLCGYDCSGGILNQQGSVVLSNSSVSGNSSPWMGGGIYNYGVMTITNTSITGNQAGTQCCSGGGGGGGIDNEGTMVLNASTVSGNTILNFFYGPGIYNGYYPTMTLTLNNSTVFSNTGGYGEGIYTFGGALTINSSTIANNSKYGVYDLTADTTIQNSILANNGTIGNDCYKATGYFGGVTSLGYNLIRSNTNCSLIGTDIGGQDPKLGSLQNNGGSTATASLLAGSPAINAGNPGGCTGSSGTLTTDQRSFPRIGNCDIGAFESQPLDSSRKLVNVASTPIGGVLNYTISLTNSTGSGLPSVLVTDTLPSSLTYVDASLSAPSGSFGFAGGVITWTGSLNSNSNLPITFQATVNSDAPGGATIVNTALIDDGTVIVPKTASVNTNSPLALSSKTASKSTLYYGESLSYTIAMTNSAPVSINVMMTDTLPASLSYVGGSLTAPSGVYGYSDGVITWAGSISPGSSVPVVFSANANPGAPSGTTITNAAAIDHAGEILTRTVNALGLSPLTLSAKTVDRAQAYSGETASYSVSLTNTAGISLNNVIVTDTLPALLAYVNGSLSAPNGSFGYASGVITWTGTIPANSNLNVTFDAMASPATPSGTMVSNSALIDQGGGAITRSKGILVLNPLTAAKTANKSSAQPGELIAYTIAVTNAANVASGPVLITDTLPVGLTYSNGSLTATTGSYGIAGNVITWTGSIDPISNVQLTFGGLANSSNTNTATVNRAGQILMRSASITVQTKTYLPLILKSIVCNTGISGRVTAYGASAAGVGLQLRFYNGSSYSTFASTTTAADGSYQFLGAPSLSPGQGYYVRYLNVASDSTRLSYWATRFLTTYAAGQCVSIGNFDLADIVLVGPYGTVPFPQTFYWNTRPASPSDSYQFNLFTPSNPPNYTPAGATSPLGYVGSFTLNSLPAGFNTNTPYGWFAAANSPDGGYGESYYYFSIAFSNTGFGPALRLPASPKATQRDLPFPSRRR